MEIHTLIQFLLLNNILYMNAKVLHLWDIMPISSLTEFMIFLSWQNILLGIQTGKLLCLIYTVNLYFIYTAVSLLKQDCLEITSTIFFLFSSVIS